MPDWYDHAPFEHTNVALPVLDVVELWVAVCPLADPGKVALHDAVAPQVNDCALQGNATVVPPLGVVQTPLMQDTIDPAAVAA